LRYADALSGAAEMKLFGDRNEMFELLDVHGVAHALQNDAHDFDTAR
jgi:hypothetical protein